MLWGGRWEGGSCLGTHVRIKDFKIKKKKNNNKIKLSLHSHGSPSADLAKCGWCKTVVCTEK